MSFAPSPLQTLFLWRLLASEGGEFFKNIKPKIEAKQRNALEAAGFVACEKRKQSAEKRAPASLYVSLTEQGWQWAAANLDAEFSMQSTASGPVLRAVLGKLKTHLERTGGSLADFICPPEIPATQPAADLTERIRRGYYQAGGGRWNVRVRLTDLRRELADVPRADLDAALLGMERRRELLLDSLDDPSEVGPDDRLASIPNTLGIPRYILFIER